MDAQFVHGNPLMMDYTPGSAVAAGDVIEINTSCVIAHSAIPADTLGAVACGGGVYRVASEGTIGGLEELSWYASGTSVVLPSFPGAGAFFGLSAPQTDVSGTSTLLAIHILNENFISGSS